MSAPPDNRNIYGRKWGRGIRPYLLLPKYLCVAVFVGGLISMLVQGFILPAEDTLAGWQHRGQLLRNSYVFVIVPGLLGAIFMGLLLLSTHLGAFIRMRWLQVKLVLIALCVPALHMYMRGRAEALHTVLQRGTADDLQEAARLWSDLRSGTLACLLFALVIVFLGRIKPRLWQDYGRTFARRTPAMQAPPAGRATPASPAAPPAAPPPDTPPMHPTSGQH